MKANDFQPKAEKMFKLCLNNECRLYDKTDYASKLTGTGVKVSGTATPLEESVSEGE